MNKYLFKSLAFGLTALLMNACNDSESDLLKPKVYFENREYNITVDDNKDEITFNLTSRLSSSVSSSVEVSYSLADEGVVNNYNTQYGTNYEFLDESHVSLSHKTSTIPEGSLFANTVELKFSNLNALEEGKPYIMPITVQSNSVANEGGNIAYFLINKPLKITQVGEFNNDYISVKFPAGTFFKSFTYETLLYVNYFGSNNTIMGTEGVMILRIGDMTLPSNKIIELAGRQHYNVKDELKENQWYHIAATYDQPSGKTAIYVNGEKWAESNWSIPGFDPNSDVGFNIGKLAGFPWGERPINGYMSEIRVWSIARTENQLKQNMLNVDPKSEGLELYYKLNGSETQEGLKIQDSTGKINAETSGIIIKKLEKPVDIK